MKRYPRSSWPAAICDLPSIQAEGGITAVPMRAVAAFFGCGPSNLREMRRQGRLANIAYRHGNDTYYDIEDVADAYLDKYPLRAVTAESGDDDNWSGYDTGDTITLPDASMERSPGMGDASEQALFVPQNAVMSRDHDQLTASLTALTKTAQGIEHLIEQIRSMEYEHDTEAGELRQVLRQQSDTIEHQRAEIERLTRASEPRQMSWWQRLTTGGGT